MTAYDVTNEHDSQDAAERHAKPKNKFQIQIDRTHYTITEPQLTGVQLRQVPDVPIGPDRDLFEVVPGGLDRKIEDSDVVDMRNGLRFFTAPSQINPGAQIGS